MKLEGLVIRKSFRNVSTKSCSGRFDVTVIGGGIIGVATARQLLLQHPNLKIALLEKENRLAKHQTGHNSGVIHAGIYYKPGSLKAKLCVEGSKSLMNYCDTKGIAYKKIGKLIVATDDKEVELLKDLYKRSLTNAVDGVELIDTPDGISKIEPECRGLKAIWSPNTAIVDFATVTNAYADDFCESRGEIYLNSEVKKIEESGNEDFPVRIMNSRSEFIETKRVLTCTGLYSDRVAAMTGCPTSPKIVPIRGEYLLLKPEKVGMVKCNIYPVPNPDFPFLGVHFTPRMDGSVWLGPNAVLAFKREGYKYSDVDLKDLVDALNYPGFQHLAMKNLRYGLGEFARSIFWSLQVKKLQKYLPNIKTKDCTPGPAGVRAQALETNGSLLEDFCFDKSRNGGLQNKVLHCRNCPSPGATSSMAIAKMLVEKMTDEFQLGGKLK